jgi:hypothetical protein
LRFSRDKRGYENTFVVHVGRRRGKTQSRVLYWFRTPPGVRVGRAALDEDAIRLIEQHNPDVEFDWTRILKGQDAPPEPKPSYQQERRARPRPRPFPAPVPVPAPARPHPDVPIGELSPIEVSVDQSTSEPPMEAFTGELGSALLEPEVLVPEVQPNAEVPPDEPVGDTQPTAAEARLGFEGISRLRARHAEVLTRISEKVTDTVRRDELKSEAERLNPDTWVTDAEVTAGLEAYETVFESLRGVVGRRRKRRRSSGSGQAAPAVFGTDGSEPGPEAASSPQEENAQRTDLVPDPETGDELGAGADDRDEDL